MACAKVMVAGTTGAASVVACIVKPALGTSNSICSGKASGSSVSRAGAMPETLKFCTPTPRTSSAPSWAAYWLKRTGSPGPNSPSTTPPTDTVNRLSASMPVGKSSTAVKSGVPVIVYL